MKFNEVVNATPHPLDVYDETGTRIVLELPHNSTDPIARAGERAVRLSDAEVSGVRIAVHGTSYGKVTGLPEPRDGVWYVVALPVAIAAPETSQETIVRGPSKFELMLALFDYTTENGRTVTFLVGNAAAMTSGSTGRELAMTGAERVKVVINGVGRESGDGESWIFNGYVPGTDTVILDGGTRTVTPQVEGYYNTLRNQGWLKRGVIR